MTSLFAYGAESGVDARPVRQQQRLHGARLSGVRARQASHMHGRPWHFRRAESGAGARSRPWA